MEFQFLTGHVIVRPSGKRGIEIQAFAHDDIKVELLLEIYGTPCLQLSLPLFTFYIGWFNREENEKLDAFFKPWKEGEDG